MRPDPSRPVIPRISPARRVKEISSKWFLLASPLASSRTGAARQAFAAAADVQIQLAAGHQLDQTRTVQRTGRLVGHLFAVAHDDRAVGDLQHFVQLVADKQRADALLLGGTNHGKQRADLLLRKRRRRLVHDDQARILQQRLGNGDQLAVDDRQLPDTCIQVQLHVDACQRGGGGAAHVAPVDELAILGHLLVECQVLRHRKVGKQREVLVDDLDALANGLDRVHLRQAAAVEHDLAGIGRIDPGNHLDQRRFARPVFADQTGDLAAQAATG